MSCIFSIPFHHQRYGLTSEYFSISSSHSRLMSVFHICSIVFRQKLIRKSFLFHHRRYCLLYLVYFLGALAWITSFISWCFSRSPFGLSVVTQKLLARSIISLSASNFFSFDIPYFHCAGFFPALMCKPSFYYSVFLDCFQFCASNN